MAKAFASQADLEVKKVTWTKLSENAYAYTAEGDPNSGVIIGDDGVLIVGAGLAGLSAALEAARAGNTCEQFAGAFFAVLKKYGIVKDGRTGYGIGVSYPPDWGERTISIRSEDESVLETNMTFHIVCGMWMDDYGFELSESVRVSPTGVETFTGFPRELIRK